MNDTGLITQKPGKRDGRPCTHGLRISVYRIPAIFAEGVEKNEMLKNSPELEMIDIRTSLAYAASREQSVRQIIV